MKNLVMLTENELSQVSGGGKKLDAVNEGLIKSSIDKIFLGSLALILAPTMGLLGTRLRDFIFDEPDENDMSDRKPRTAPAS